MAIVTKRDVYRGGLRIKIPVALPICVAAVIVITFLTLFYSLQKYIIYDQDGLSVELPMLAAPEPPDSSESMLYVPKNYEFPAEIIIEKPDYSDLDLKPGEDLTAVRALYVMPDKLGELSLILTQMEQAGANALVVDVKPESGQLAYESMVESASSFGANGTLSIAENVAALKEEGVYLIARICCFADKLMATRNLPFALSKADGEPYVDGDGVYWLDPYNRDIRDYTIELIRELRIMGFDEVLLAYLQHPSVADGFVYSADKSPEMDTMSAISSFAVKMAGMSGDGFSVSAVCLPDALRTGKNDMTGQDAGLFFRIFDRVYVSTSPDMLSSDRACAGGYVSSGDTDNRFVPIISSVAGLDSWLLR